MPTLAEQPYVIVRLVDETTSRAEFRIHVRRGTTAAAGLAGAAQLATLAAAASDAVPVERILRYPLRLVGEPKPAAGALTNYVGVLVFRTAVEGQYGMLEIPGINLDLVVATDATILDISAPPLAALISYVINNGFTNPFGYPLTECIGGLFEIRR